jgi:hypothetical protein
MTGDKRIETMPVDLTYLTELPSEAQEKAVREAVEQECLRAIANYLGEVADTMEANKVETLNVPTLRAMAEQLTQRIETYNAEEQNS